MIGGGVWLFVYGTLLTGSETPANLWLEQRSCAIGETFVSGRLIAIPTQLGWYPALLPPRSTGDRVRGMVMQLDFRPGDWRWLDAYEGDEYRLAKLSAGVGRVWAYRWKAAIPSGTRPIPHGDFLRWIGDTGRQPYCETPLRHQAGFRPFGRV